MSDLDFRGLPNTDPYNPPVGWFRPAASQTARILQALGVGRVQRSTGTGNQCTAILDSIQYTGNTIFAEVIIGSNQTTNSSNAPRCGFVNSSNNGYAFWISQDGLTVRIYEVANFVFGATEVWSATGFGAGLGQTFNFRCVDKTTGTFKVLRNGVQVGSDFVSTTYTGLVYSGVIASNGGVQTISTGAIADWLAVTDPITMGGAISAVTTGYTNVTGISGGGMSATGLSYSSGTTTGTWPAISESIAPTVALPATGVTLTLTDGTTSRTRTSDIDLYAGWASVEFGALIDEPDYLLSEIPIVDGYYAYYETNQPVVGDVIIYPDGGVYTDNSGTFSLYLHKLGTGDPLVRYDVTSGGGGESSGGLSIAGLSNSGLSNSGLSVSGL